MSDFLSDPSAGSVVQFPDIWNRGQKSIKMKRKRELVRDLRCSLGCCGRFGQVFWHVTRCVTFPGVSKGQCLRNARLFASLDEQDSDTIYPSRW